METETWRAICGYEGIYEVSNLGRVRSLERIVTIPGKIKQLSNKSFPHCLLSKNGETKNKSVRMIMAEAFPEMSVDTGRRRMPERVSSYKGVYWSKKKQKWEAAIKAPGIFRSLGFFEDEKDASERWEEVNAEWIRYGWY
jgi:hypothetical protein